MDTEQINISTNTHMNTSMSHRVASIAVFSFAQTSVYVPGSARPTLRAAVVTPEGTQGQEIVFVSRTTKLHAPFCSGPLRAAGALGLQ